jgi:hypothetical protein
LRSLPHQRGERGNRPKSRESNFLPSLQFQPAFNKSTDELVRYSVQRTVPRHGPIPNDRPLRRWRRRAVARRVSFRHVTCTPSPRTTPNLTPHWRTYAADLSGHVCSASVPLTNLSRHPEPVSRTLSDPTGSSLSLYPAACHVQPSTSHTRFNNISRNPAINSIF